MPERLTTAEGIDRLSDEVAAKLLQMRMSTDASSPPSGWSALRAEWIKPSGIIPLAGLLFTCVVGGAALNMAVVENTKANARQDVTLSKQTETLTAIGRQIERAGDISESRASQQREELLAWREWRKTIDTGMQTLASATLEVAANKTRAEALDIRISRVVELFQATVKEMGEKQEAAARETNQKLERILIEQAQVRTRLEGRSGERPPFLESPTWIAPQSPLILRAHGRLPAFLRELRGNVSAPF